jgi:hypothetical protein
VCFTFVNMIPSQKKLAGSGTQQQSARQEKMDRGSSTSLPAAPGVGSSMQGCGLEKEKQYVQYKQYQVVRVCTLLYMTAV